MDSYDEGYLRIAEEKRERIYDQALERARKTVPEAEFVIDNRTMDAISQKCGIILELGM